MVALPLQECVVGNVAVMGDRLCIVDVEKAVLLWRCIL